MTFKDEAGWNESVRVNQDPYGSCVMRYTENWANLMEQHIKEGKTVAECAKSDSHTADTEGITGFMYGCAVSILSQVWTYGEELRLWHNLGTQIGKEGERANESGGVLNPALLNIDI